MNPEQAGTKPEYPGKRRNKPGNPRNETGNPRNETGNARNNRNSPALLPFKLGNKRRKLRRSADSVTAY
jgi:hypothetical protein